MSSVEHIRFSIPEQRGQRIHPDMKVRIGELAFDRGMPPRCVDQIITVLIELGVDKYDATCRHDWHYMNRRQIHEFIRRRAPRSEREYYEMREKVQYFSNPSSSEDIYSQFAEAAGLCVLSSSNFAVAPTTAQLNKAQDNTMSNENKYDPKTGALLPKGYESRIKTGDSLVVGKSYRLEVVGGKNPPEIAEAGQAFFAIGDSEGNYNGEVIDLATFRVFSTDASDLWIAA